MYTIIMNNGDYRDVNVNSLQQALIFMHLLFTEDEIEEYEMEVVQC